MEAAECGALNRLDPIIRCGLRLLNSSVMCLPLCVASTIQAADGWRVGGWANDYPDCDLNFSFRLQQLTTLQVNPNAVTLRLDDPKLLDHPFLFMTNMGGISLSEPERLGLRRYLLRGGS